MEGKKYKILFVCLGNICRSPAAEGVMQSIVDRNGRGKDFVIDSAGTGDYHVGDLADPRMRAAAKRRGLTLTHRCRQVCPRDFDDFDLIIGMDRNNERNLRAMAPRGSADKVHGIGQWLSPDTGYDYVPDPYYGGQEDFELALDLLENACATLYDQVTAQ